jgi:PAS domain-containing protein
MDYGSTGPPAGETPWAASEARKQLDELREQLIALEQQNEELKRIRDDFAARLQQRDELDPQELVREVNLLRRPQAAADSLGRLGRSQLERVAEAAEATPDSFRRAMTPVDPVREKARLAPGDAAAPRTTEAGRLGGMHDILERANRAARIGFWEIDLARSRTTWSTVTREIHEMPPNVEPGQTSAIDFQRQGASRERLQAAMDAAIASGDPYDLELQITTGRGEDRWIRTIGLAEMADDKCLRLYGTVQDIDARVRAEEARLAQVRAEAAYRFKSQFLSEMSHELRTPLNAVLGFAHLMAADPDEPPSPRQTKRLLYIQRAGTQLVELIDDAINPSASDGGQ